MTHSTFPRILLAGAASSLLLAGASFALAKTVELRNDTLQNNGDASAVCGFNVGEKFAARFTPPAYPARLLKVRVLLSAVTLSTVQCNATDVDNQIQMPMEVFHFTSAMPGTSFGEFSSYVYSSDTVLNELDVNAANMTIDDGSFVVAYTLTQTNASPVHDASNAAVTDANYIYADMGLGADWYSFGDLAASNADPKGNWIIRVDVSVPDDAVPDGGTGGTGGSSGDSGASGGTGGSGNSCTTNTDCTGGQTCDTDLGECVEVNCSIDTDCSAGYVCRTDLCRKVCTQVADCQSGESCEESSGVKVCTSGASATPPAADSGDSGGCVVAGTGMSERRGIAGLALALGLAVSRLARSRRRARV